MSPLLFLAAALAGGVGAVLRYLVDVGVARLAGRRFPWGILIVNLTGSFALGVVTTALPETAFVLGAGLLGGYTTFSTARGKPPGSGTRSPRPSRADVPSMPPSATSRTRRRLTFATVVAA